MTSESHITIGEGRFRHTDLPGLLGARLQQLPHVLRLLAENHLRTTGKAGALLDALDARLEGRTSSF